MRLKKWVNYAVFFLLLLLPWQTRWIFKQITFLGESISLGSLSFYFSQTVIVLLFIGLVTIAGLGFHFTKVKKKKLIAAMALFGYLLFLLTAVRHIDLALVHYSMVGFAVLLGVVLMHPWVERKTIFAGVSISLVLPVLLGLYQVGAGGSPASTLFGLALRDAQILGDSVFFLGGERILRAYGSFSHPNIFAGYLLVGIWSAWQWMRSLDLEGPRGREIKFIAKAIFAVLIIGLLSTGSQAAWLGALIAGAWMFVEHRTDAASEYRITVLIGAAILALVSIWAGDGASFLERQDQYVLFLGLMDVQNLAVGVGPLHYIFHLSRSIPGFDWWQYQPMHNAVLLVVSEIGIIGAGLLGYLAWPKVKSLFMSPNFLILLALIPPIFLDHYFWTTWSGLVIVVLLMSIDMKRSNH